MRTTQMILLRGLWPGDLQGQHEHAEAMVQELLRILAQHGVLRRLRRGVFREFVEEIFFGPAAKVSIDQLELALRMADDEDVVYLLGRELQQLHHDAPGLFCDRNRTLRELHLMLADVIVDRARLGDGPRSPWFAALLRLADDLGRFFGSEHCRRWEQWLRSNLPPTGTDAPQRYAA